MAIHFTSDVHFDHKNIIEYSKRPFKDVAEMNEELVANWNMAVAPEDTVYELGDFCFGDLDRFLHFYGRLNGRIVKIIGNHDVKRLKGMKELELRDGRKIPIHDYLELKGAHPDIKMIVLSHYPMLRWNQCHRGSYMLHGHEHGSIDHLNKDVRRMDVGVDSCSYRPIRLEEVHEKLKLKQITQHHEHGNESRNM